MASVVTVSEVRGRMSCWFDPLKVGGSQDLSQVPQPDRRICSRRDCPPVWRSRFVSVVEVCAQF